MGLELKHYPKTEEATIVCAEKIAQMILTSLPEPTMLFLSGGSCLTVFPILYQYLVEKNHSLSALVIGFADERFDQAESNYVSLQKKYPTLLDSLKEKGVTCIDTTPSKKDQYEMAQWYDEKIHEHIDTIKKSQGKVIALLGMGSDGHIAGILPFPDDEKTFTDLFVSTPKIVVGYDATGKNEFAHRFTLTFQGLRSCDAIIGFVTGEKKRHALQTVVNAGLLLHECPGVFLYHTTIPVLLYTDIAL